MRPYLLLIAVVLMAVAAFGQQPVPRPGPGFYGYGPFIPLVTTPEISLQTVSPNPVGATNATTGLIAGATNATLSEIQGSTSSVYTEAAWYQGGAPLTTSQVHLWPEPLGREGRVMHEPPAFKERSREERAPRQEARAVWMYYTGAEHSSDAALVANQAKGVRKATHVPYNNDDVKRQNEKNGTVTYRGKTEKM